MQQGTQYGLIPFPIDPGTASQYGSLPPTLPLPRTEGYSRLPEFSAKQPPSSQYVDLPTTPSPSYAPANAPSTAYESFYSEPRQQKMPIPTCQCVNYKWEIIMLAIMVLAIFLLIAYYLYHVTKALKNHTHLYLYDKQLNETRKPRMG
jgi:hypothetical protein